jgi:hypothetical protein
VVVEQDEVMVRLEQVVLVVEVRVVILLTGLLDRLILVVVAVAGV